jgi:hypothetical protein
LSAIDFPAEGKLEKKATKHLTTRKKFVILSYNSHFGTVQRDYVRRNFESIPR